MRWMTLALPIALLAGCATKPTPVSDACLVVSPLLFDRPATIDWLNRNDQDLLRAIVAHNEAWDALDC